MTKEVLISISGVQCLDEEQGAIEMITKGTYYEKDGKRYFLYDEFLEDGEGVIHNTIKLGPDSMEIIKRGSISAHMVFERGKKRLARYLTPVGELTVGIQVDRLILREEEHFLEVKVEYSLELNSQHVSECRIRVTAQSLGMAEIPVEAIRQTNPPDA